MLTLVWIAIQSIVKIQFKMTVEAWPLHERDLAIDPNKFSS